MMDNFTTWLESKAQKEEMAAAITSKFGKANVVDNRNGEVLRLIYVDKITPEEWEAFVKKEFGIEPESAFKFKARNVEITAKQDKGHTVIHLRDSEK